MHKEERRRTEPARKEGGLHAKPDRMLDREDRS
ncbi:hypothetical protein Q427_11125 [Halomonas sp. BC04]|nr:hypothetical protein Q427_11125 [Halomonas sp. BC04]